MVRLYATTGSRSEVSAECKYSAPNEEFLYSSRPFNFQHGKEKNCSTRPSANCRSITQVSTQSQFELPRIARW